MNGEIYSSIDAIASCQAGVVSRRQALSAGLTPGAITWQLRRGRWRQIYRGVYATHASEIVREARLWAAVLYAGAGARLSHETAAEVHGLVPRPATLIHVTVPPTRRVRPAQGLTIHIAARADYPSAPRGILPCTMPEETVLDLVHAAGSLDAARGLVTSAFTAKLTSAGRLWLAMTSRKRLRWRRQLEEIVAAAATAAAAGVMTEALPA